MLTCHPDINIPPESHWFLWLHERYKQWRPSEGIDAFLDDLFACTKIETWELDRTDLQLAISREAPANYSDLVSLVYQQYGKKHGAAGSRWGDKNSLWIEKIPTILECFPNAQLIHLVRDGRDVACSYLELGAKTMDSKYAPKLPQTIREIAEIWMRNVEYVQQFGKDLGPDQYQECKYENLLNDATTSIQRMTEFLDLPYDDRMVDYHKSDANASLEPKDFMQWKPKLMEPIDQSNSGKYLHELSNAEIAEFQQIAGDTLRKYGYPIHE